MKNLVLLFFALNTSLAFAQWNKVPFSEYDLPNPPQKGSVEYQKDFETLLRYQEFRTDKDCKAAAAQEFPGFRVMYESSGIFTDEQIVKYEKFIHQVGGYANKISDKFKEEFRRKRPYDADTRVQPCIKKPGGSKSYPSGHGTLGATSACVLAMILPQKAKEITAWGDYLGELRVIAGVHHPSDIAAARDLSLQICHRLAREPDFQAELTKLSQGEDPLTAL